jgi:hypothetical protein
MNNHYIITNGQKIIVDNKNRMNTIPLVFIPDNHYKSYDYNEDVEELILPAYR